MYGYDILIITALGVCNKQLKESAHCLTDRYIKAR